MSGIRKSIVILLLLMFAFSTVAFAETKYPSPTREFFVNDFADVLDLSTEKRIISLGKQLEDKTGAQIVLVTIESLGEKDIDDYATELFRKWGIGQKDEDNGILILNAVQDRMLRIEVGYGLEGAVPDIRTAQIRKDYMNPYLSKGDYNGGLYNGYAMLVQDVAKEYGVDIDYGNELPRNSQWTPERSKPSGSARKSGMDFGPILLVMFLIFDGIFFRFRITSTLMRIFLWSSFFGGGYGGHDRHRGRGGRGNRGGRGGFGGGSFGGGGASRKF